MGPPGLYSPCILFGNANYSHYAKKGGEGGQKASLMYSVYWTPKGSANDSDQSYVTIPLEFLFLSQKCFLVEKYWTVINKAPCPNTFEVLARVDENRN